MCFCFFLCHVCWNTIDKSNKKSTFVSPNDHRKLHCSRYIEMVKDTRKVHLFKIYHKITKINKIV